MSHKEVGAFITAAVAFSGVILSANSHIEAYANSEAVPGLDKYAVALLGDILQERAEHGKSFLHTSSTITEIEDVEINNMITGSYFDHVTPDKNSFEKTLETIHFPHKESGEVFARNNANDSEEAAMAAFKKSPEHEAIILGDFDEIGIAHEKVKDPNSTFKDYYAVGFIKFADGYIPFGGRKR